jgi:hypothetical protein
LQWRVHWRFNHVLSAVTRKRAFNPKNGKKVSRQDFSRLTFGLNQMDDVATRADLGVLRNLWNADSAATDTSGARASALEVTQKLARLAKLRLDFVARKHHVDVPRWKGLFTGSAVDERRRRLGDAGVAEEEWTGRPVTAFWQTLGGEPVFEQHLRQLALEATGGQGAADGSGGNASAAAGAGGSGGNASAAAGAGGSGGNASAAAGAGGSGGNASVAAGAGGSGGNASAAAGASTSSSSKRAGSAASGVGAKKRRVEGGAAYETARAAAREICSRDLQLAALHQPATGAPPAVPASPSLMARFSAAATAAGKAAAAAWGTK